MTFGHDTDDDREYAALILCLPLRTQELIFRQLDIVRREALEEAEKVAEEHHYGWKAASAIRALKNDSSSAPRS